MFTCEYCNTNFSAKCSLNNHQKTAKYCLTKQGIVSNLYTCDFCSKSYSTVYYLSDHHNTCSAKREYDTKTKDNAEMENLKREHIRLLEDVKHDYESRLKSMEQEMSFKERYYEAMLQEKERLLQERESRLEKTEQTLSKRMDDITDIARQTKVKTKNTNIILNQTGCLNLKDTDSIHQILIKHLDDNVLAEGQRGLAKMVSRTLLTNANGDKLYECTDRSRQQFEYVDPDGNLIRDAKGTNLKTALLESKLKDVAYNNGEKMWQNEDGGRDMERFNVFSDKVREVAELGYDDTKFRSELSTLLS